MAVTLNVTVGAAAATAANASETSASNVSQADALRIGRFSVSPASVI